MELSYTTVKRGTRDIAKITNLVVNYLDNSDDFELDLTEDGEYYIYTWSFKGEPTDFAKIKAILENEGLL